MMTARKLIIAPAEDFTDEDRWHDVSLLLMESVEPIEAPAAKSNS